LITCFLLGGGVLYDKFDRQGIEECHD